MTKDSIDSTPSPKELEKRFNHACSLHENNRLDDAVEAYGKLLSNLPNSPLLHFNCGLALFELELFREAGKHYKIASRLNPEDPDIHYNTGLNYRRLKKYEDAAKSFEHAVKLGDASPDTLYNLGLCYQDLQNYSEAERLYDMILVQDPEHLSTLNNSAYLCHKTGDLKKAETLYRQLLTLNPEHRAAKHMLNSLSGKLTDSAPLEYVEAVFDNYAQGFEHSLVEELHYNTPKGLWERFSKLPYPKKNQCLDLGCGTGLAGEQFAPCCQELTGVDISQEMLDVADKKNLYKDLIKDDILHFLHTTELSYDLILAADVFTYMGDLEKLFNACHEKTVTGGLFLFSVEESASETFELKQTGRFGHSAGYIEKLCQNTGWNILDCHLSKLRQDKGKWIKGYLFILQR
ncbi:MAG: tetratricopeptide repeat protein [Thermodesulfobacteriota bacterium]|nr:tetratricopeptide repeat protein [Thermodesulfobacteriota bacterium]